MTINDVKAPEQGSAEEKITVAAYYVEHDDKLPNVLLLGDSISIGYHQTVVKALQGKANVYRPIVSLDRAENCAYTDRGVENIERWLGDKKWTVIHFNWGLHDLKRLDMIKDMNSDDPSLPPINEPDVYGEKLAAIVEVLKKTDAKLIMATTTPYPEGVRPCRVPEDAIIYNQVALKIAEKNNIEVNDLYSFALERLSEIQIHLNVHFTTEGSKVLGEEVAKVIQAHL